MDKLIYGADTETVKGKPNSIQFYSEDTPCEEIHFCNTKTARNQFIAWCERRKPRVLHVVYMHMLSFDIIELFWGMHEKLIGNGGEFEFTCGAWDVRGLYGTPTYCVLSRGHDRRIVLVDSFSFYRGTLAQAAELFCPNLPKLQRLSDIGQRRYTAKDTGFVEYAMRDAVIAYHIGKFVEGLHHEFDVQQCISVADMASRIFRHKYLTYTIPLPTPEILSASLDAYHGGKNNLAVAPGRYHGVTGIDISSAYTDAMLQLPAFSDATLYRRYSARGSVRSVPPWGVYRVSGHVAHCKWPSLFNHAFKPVCGKIDGIHVAGLEVNESLRSGELRITKIEGWYYDAEHDNQAPALRQFCEDFYSLKENSPDKVTRYGYKTVANSISGKFIQTRKRRSKCYYDIDSGKETTASELRAGGLFNPFIACSITAHTRSRIHRLEHHYQALHTATDGIFTTLRPDRSGDFLVRRTAQRIGDLTTETEGDLLLVRNKLYIVYGPDGKIVKAALHGFQGDARELERMIETGERRYKKARPNRLKESIKRGLTPNEFIEREYLLKVGAI